MTKFGNENNCGCNCGCIKCHDGMIFWSGIYDTSYNGLPNLPNTWQYSQPFQSGLSGDFYNFVNLSGSGCSGSYIPNCKYNLNSGEWFFTNYYQPITGDASNPITCSVISGSTPNSYIQITGVSGEGRGLYFNFIPTGTCVIRAYTDFNAGTYAEYTSDVVGSGYLTLYINNQLVDCSDYFPIGNFWFQDGTLNAPIGMTCFSIFHNRVYPTGYKYFDFICSPSGGIGTYKIQASIGDAPPYSAFGGDVSLFSIADTSSHITGSFFLIPNLPSINNVFISSGGFNSPYNYSIFSNPKNAINVGNLDPTNYATVTHIMPNAATGNMALSIQSGSTQIFGVATLNMPEIPQIGSGTRLPSGNICSLIYDSCFLNSGPYLPLNSPALKTNGNFLYTNFPHDDRLPFGTGSFYNFPLSGTTFLMGTGSIEYLSQEQNESPYTQLTFNNADFGFFSRGLYIFSNTSGNTSIKITPSYPNSGDYYYALFETSGLNNNCLTTGTGNNPIIVPPNVIYTNSIYHSVSGLIKQVQFSGYDSYGNASSYPCCASGGMIGLQAFIIQQICYGNGFFNIYGGLINNSLIQYNGINFNASPFVNTLSASIPTPLQSGKFTTKIEVLTNTANIPIVIPELSRIRVNRPDTDSECQFCATCSPVDFCGNLPNNIFLTISGTSNISGCNCSAFNGEYTLNNFRSVQQNIGNCPYSGFLSSPIYLIPGQTGIIQYTGGPNLNYWSNNLFSGLCSGSTFFPTQTGLIILNCNYLLSGGDVSSIGTLCGQQSTGLNGVYIQSGDAVTQLRISTTIPYFNNRWGNDNESQYISSTIVEIDTAISGFYSGVYNLDTSAGSSGQCLLLYTPHTTYSGTCKSSGVVITETYSCFPSIACSSPNGILTSQAITTGLGSIIIGGQIFCASGSVQSYTVLSPANIYLSDIFYYSGLFIPQSGMLCCNSGALIKDSGINSYVNNGSLNNYIVQLTGNYINRPSIPLDYCSQLFPLNMSGFRAITSSPFSMDISIFNFSSNPGNHSGQCDFPQNAILSLT